MSANLCPRLGVPHQYWPQGNCQYCGELAPPLAAKDAEIAKLREALELILPLAKGYAATNNVGNNDAYIAQAEAALEGGAS